MPPLRPPLSPPSGSGEAGCASPRAGCGDPAAGGAGTRPRAATAAGTTDLFALDQVLPQEQEDPNAKQVCFTGKDARIESGMPVVAAVLIEPEGEPKKILRVTLPLGMQLVHGTRVIVDQNQPMTAPYVICFTNGCMADYEATTDMIDKMKKGQGLIVQAINSTGQPISLVLPLGDFAKAYDGPPTDPKVFEEQQQEIAGRTAAPRRRSAQEAGAAAGPAAIVERAARAATASSNNRQFQSNVPAERRTSGREF